MSHESHDLAPELKSLEAALAGLAPRGSAIDRDRLLYAAGTAAAQSVTRRRLLSMGLPAVAVMCLVPALVFGSLWLRERKQLIAERAAHAIYFDTAIVQLKPVPAAAVLDTGDRSPVLVADKNSYLRLRNVVLEGGAEAMESSAGTVLEMESLRARDAWLQGI